MQRCDPNWLSGIGGLEYWTEILEWPKLLIKPSCDILESGYSLSHFPNFLHASLTSVSGACLTILPRSLGGHSSIPVQ